jgi:hypothetical protein
MARKRPGPWATELQGKEDERALANFPASSDRRHAMHRAGDSGAAEACVGAPAWIVDHHGKPKH